MLHAPGAGWTLVTYLANSGRGPKTSTLVWRTTGPPDTPTCAEGPAGPTPHLHQCTTTSRTGHPSAGDTWRIRGILENHQPDVTRRAESSVGRLPDVTHHTQTNSASSIQHARTRSVPVGGIYDARVPSSSSYDIHHHQQPQPQVVSRSSTQGIICARSHQDGLQHTSLPTTIICNSRQQPAETSSMLQPRREVIAAPQQQLKRDQVTSPWVTRSTQMDRQINSTDISSRNPPNNNWSNHQQQQQQQQQHQHQQPSTSSCWRPNSVTSPPHNVLNQCPLPDLVTPRRQARKQCCGLLATHSVAIRCRPCSWDILSGSESDRTLSAAEGSICPGHLARMRHVPRMRSAGYPRQLIAPLVTPRRRMTTLESLMKAGKGFFPRLTFENEGAKKTENGLEIEE
ncbi:uncharacterized protein CEXT_441031 [Caerostris extrusa]|uniref:Uncharacterized protein n=1 Tax=Caerostris extrusa TaxID=172846 RepID=A0AAV4NFC1_CAEEX|nr:uncharacterized protein CEXT_441031 [Caerostris extrusa]